MQAGPQTIVKITFAGKEFLLLSAKGADLVARGIQDGSYEAPLPMILSALVARTTGLFLDVGANNGVYSMIAAATRADVHVIAFEPFPPVLSLLRDNIALNKFQGRIKVQPVALSDSKGAVPIYLPAQDHGLVETSASLQAGFIANSQSTMTVPTARLDDIPIDDPVSVIKVDIEGFELEFLRGASALIARDRPFIFAEMLSASTAKFPEISQRLFDHGYMAFRLRPDQAIHAHWIVFDEHAWNYALIPVEKLPLFRAVCTVHGLEILAAA